MAKIWTIRHRHYRLRPEAAARYRVIGMIGGVLITAGVLYGLLVLVLIAL